MYCVENNLLIYLLIFLIFFSCRTDDKNIKFRKKALNHSQNIVGVSEYNIVRDNINDSIQNWIKHHFARYERFNTSHDYLIDSLMCFNNIGNKMICLLYSRSHSITGNHDDVIYLYGAKVEGEWLFWDGATMVLIRERYQDDIHTPIPFPKMQELATKYIYSNYLIKDETGEWVINDHFFDGFDQYNNIYNMYGDCLDCKNEIEFYRHCVAKNWSEYNAEKQVQKKWEIMYDTVSPVKPNITK